MCARLHVAWLKRGSGRARQCPGPRWAHASCCVQPECTSPLGAGSLLFPVISGGVQTCPSRGWWICTIVGLLALSPTTSVRALSQPSERCCEPQWGGGMQPRHHRAASKQGAQYISYNTLIMLRTIPAQKRFCWETSSWLQEVQK